MFHKRLSYNFFIHQILRNPAIHCPDCCCFLAFSHSSQNGVPSSPDCFRTCAWALYVSGFGGLGAFGASDTLPGSAVSASFGGFAASGEHPPPEPAEPPDDVQESADAARRQARVRVAEEARIARAQHPAAPSATEAPESESDFRPAPKPQSTKRRRPPRQVPAEDFDLHEALLVRVHRVAGSLRSMSEALATAARTCPGAEGAIEDRICARKAQHLLELADYLLHGS